MRTTAFHWNSSKTGRNWQKFERVTEQEEIACLPENKKKKKSVLCRFFHGRGLALILAHPCRSGGRIGKQKNEVYFALRGCRGLGARSA